MEVVKEYLLAKYFSPFGYIVAVFHLLALTALATAAGVLRTSERRRFSCPSSPDSKDDCLRQYDKQVYFGLPFYGFGKNFRTAPYFIMHAHLINYAFYPLSLNTIDNSLGN